MEYFIYIKHILLVDGIVQIVYVFVDFLRVPSIFKGNRWVEKSLTTISELSLFPFSAISFSFMQFELFLFGLYAFRIISFTFGPFIIMCLR